MSDYKPEGKCPFCGEIVRAQVVEENYVRRDRCQCPRCAEMLYVCRMPGCSNYAKGGALWDDELCLSCTAGITDTIAPVVITGIIGGIGALFSKAKSKENETDK